MNLFIFFLLLIPPDLQHGDQQVDPVHHPGSHHHYLVYPEIELYFCLDLKYQQLLDMFSEILGHDVDPKAPLNTIDMAKLLMNDSSNKVKDLQQNVREELELEREHNKKIIDAVVTGFCKRLRIIEDSVAALRRKGNESLSHPTPEF